MTSDREPELDGSRLLIVALGASAGGIEALKGFFSGVPDQPGIAFVVVTHLNPRRESMLHEIVARSTTLAVTVATDGTLVRKDTVYVLPSDAVLGIEKRRLSVRKPDPEQRGRKPIDIFFSALAVDQGEQAAGVILSGGDGDGTLGIKAIKERGGLTLVQAADGHGPQYPDMPRSAMASGMVDFALPADKMGSRIVEFARGTARGTGLQATPDEQPFGRARQDIYAILRSQTGHDFAGYKEKTFVRRVQRRMQILQEADIGAYVERLRHDPEEVMSLFRDLLINVTNFFRNAEAFEALNRQVIPPLFEDKDADDTVRLWVPACSTGEEVFSLAILLCEHMDGLTGMPRVQVFATDIDEHALAVARAARYPAALLEGVSPERRRRWFTADGASYLVNKTVRDLCVFSSHSIIRDPPFSRIDLISCRNLLIYFGLDVQNEVLPTFHYALRPGGYLFLGTSENIGQSGELFMTVDKKHRIFRSQSGSTARVPLATGLMRRADRTSQLGLRSAAVSLALRHSVEAQVLDRHAPAHVVVNDRGDIVYYSARTGRYLEPPAGHPSRQLLAMARKGLRPELHTLFHEAVENNRAVRRSHLAVEDDDGGMQMVTLTIDPLRDRPDAEPLYVILFESEGPTTAQDEAFGQRSPVEDDAAMRLERELRDTRERLQSVIEEYEAGIEELKSSNEELVSVNEEVQSSNEELEASKEELQSLNEELHTVNTELSIKIDALDQANGDLQNLFESNDLATIFLDDKMVIRRFTGPAARIFNILPGDRGRPITDITSRLDLPDFAAELTSVLSTGRPVEHRVDQAQQQACYLMRLSPYHDAGERVVGVVVTFVDITTLARVQMRQSVLIAELQHRTRNLLAMVQAIALQTLGKGGSMEAYMERLSALGRVQGLISYSTGNDVDLGEIVRLELQAHAADHGRVSVDGPPVSLRLEQVQTFALALHELATNAVKYGALHAPEGRLRVTWTVRIEPSQADGAVARLLVLDWTETGVALAPEQANARGYGRKLIERALVHTLRAETRLEFRPGGVCCRIVLPLGEGRE